MNAHEGICGYLHNGGIRCLYIKQIAEDIIEAFVYDMINEAVLRRVFLFFIVVFLWSIAILFMVSMFDPLF